LRAARVSKRCQDRSEESSWVVATHRTVETDCYAIEIRKRRPDITVVQQACPELAGSIERGLPRHALQALVGRYVNELLGKVGSPPDCFILGSTHYPLAADLSPSPWPCEAAV